MDMDVRIVKGAVALFCGGFVLLVFVISYSTPYNNVSVVRNFISNSSNHSFRSGNTQGEHFLNTVSELVNQKDYLRHTCPVIQFLQQTRGPSAILTSARVKMLAGCSIVLFLRTPKCGTRGIRDVFETLASRYGRIRNLSRTSVKKISNIQTAVQGHPDKAVVLSPHANYRNFSALGENQPILLNVVRDPLAHAISAYSWKKYGSSVNDRNEPPPEEPPKKLNMTFDECLALHGFKRPCAFPQFAQINYFCRFKPSLQEAKKNIEKYLVVGLTEQLELFFKVLEAFMPGLFHNSTAIYKERREQALQNWGTVKRETVNASSRAILEKALAPEYDLYNFVRARLYRQLDKVTKYMAT